MKLGWEDDIPNPVASEWINFVSSLKQIEEIRIDRYILTDSFQELVLLGFADASELAYGAVVYMHCTSETSTVSTKLIASKSRVAPLKTISIPRLELSACLLLSQLIEKVRLSLKMIVSDIYLHTDSKIAIAWINTSPNKLKTFIANRVSKIQTLTENYHWKHVPSHLNPADIISRGLGPQELSKMNLWWDGPLNFHKLSDESSDNTDILSHELYAQELKKMDNINLISTSENSFVDDFLNLSNNYLKLIRILSFIFRFLFNAKNAIRRRGPITTEELRIAKSLLVKMVQVKAFDYEIKTLEQGEIPKKGQAEDLTLNDHHSEMIGSYLRFAKYRRGKHLRTVEQTFEDTKLSRLMEGTFTADEVRDMLDEFCALLKGDLETELINTAHTAALLLCQMCCQAQQWHLKLNADISELENRDMLEKVNKFEEKFTNNVTNLDSPLRVNKLQPLSESSGSCKLLQMEIDRLKDENKKLSQKLKEVESHTIEILEQKSALSESLIQAQNELQEWKERKVDIVEKDLKHLEDEMLQVKKELETNLCESAFTQQHLESDLMETKQRLLEVQSQLQLAEKELELKFSQTGAFKNMKQILASKNEQIKELRQQLSKYENENGNDED